MILALLVSAAGLVGVAFTENFTWLIVSLIIWSLGATTFSPAAFALLSSSVPIERQSTAMGIYGGVFANVGILAGSALGGFAWTAWGPQLTFLMGTVSAVLGAVICFFTLAKDKVAKNLPP